MYSALAMGARDRGEWGVMADRLAKAKGWTLAAAAVGVIAGLLGLAPQAGDT